MPKAPFKRKSLYSQQQGQIGELTEQVKDRDGTIETLSRQLVQAGIKQKIMQGEVEIKKSVNDRKMSEGRSADRVKSESDLQRSLMRKNSQNGVNT